MDITPQVINEVEFHQRMRGYDPDEVDDFLERVATAVSQLQEQIGEARETAAMADRRAAEAERRASSRPPGPAQEPLGSGPSPAELSAAAEAELETLKRTLVLAQRTADAAIKEAEEQAAKTMASAAAQADELARKATEEARRVVTNAEGEARKAQEDTRRRLLQEVGSLQAARDTLRTDVTALERYLDDQRTKLRGSIGELQRVLDDPHRLRPSPVPETSPIVLPDEEPDASAAPAPRSPSDRPAATDADPSAVFESHIAEGGVEPADHPPVEDGAWARFGPELDDGGPATRPILRNDDLAAGGDIDDDAYLAELRKAMLDDTGAPDLDSSGLFDDDDDLRRSRRGFGRRR